MPGFFDGLGDTLNDSPGRCGGTFPGGVTHWLNSGKTSMPRYNSRIQHACGCAVLPRWSYGRSRGSAQSESIGRTRIAKPKWWALAFVRQCQDALDDLIAFLKPPTVSSTDEIPRCANWQALATSAPVRELRLSNALHCNSVN